MNNYDDVGSLLTLMRSLTGDQKQVNVKQYCKLTLCRKLIVNHTTGKISSECPADNNAPDVIPICKMIKRR